VNGRLRVAPEALDRALFAALLLFAFSLTVGIALTQIALGVAIALWLAKCAVRRRWLGFATPLDRWVLLFLAASILASIFSPRPADSALMLKKFYLVSPVYLLPYAVQKRQHLTSLVWMFLLGAALTAGYGLIKYFMGVDGRLLGTQPTAMHSGGIYMMASLLCLSLAMASAGRGKLPAALAALLISAGLLFTKTISAWFGWLAGLSALLWRRRWLIAGAAAVAVVLLVVAFLFRPMEAWLFFTGNKPVSLQIRLNLWRMGWHLFARRPLTGYGMISLQDQYCHIPYDNPYWDIAMSTGHMHNNFINIAVTTGLVGLSAFVILWVAIFRELAGSLRIADGELRPFALGILAAIVGFMINGLAEFNFGASVPVTVAWFLIGCSLAVKGIGDGGLNAVRNAEETRRPWKIKRYFDIIICLVLLPLLAPVFLACGAAVALGSKGPIFFLQNRVGRGGKLFRIIKFRTMVPGAQDKGPLLAERGDPRVTKVGRFLRRWSLDELPQIFNVIKGEMSLVGPRPELPQLVAGYSPWQRQVLSVLPGITGFSQVHGRDDLPMDTKLRLDAYYVRHGGLVMDAWILWRTFFELVSGRGAF